MDAIDILFIVFAIIYFIFSAIKKAASAAKETEDGKSAENESGHGQPAAKSLLERLQEKLDEAVEMEEMKKARREDTSNRAKLDDEELYELERMEDKETDTADEDEEWDEEEYEYEEEAEEEDEVESEEKRLFLLNGQESGAIEIRPAAVEPSPEPAPSKTPGPAMEKPAPSKADFMQFSNHNINNLRNAIIWSEILAPPLSERDE